MNFFTPYLTKKLNDKVQIMKRVASLILVLPWLMVPSYGQAPTRLSLTEAYNLVEANYPALRNAELLERIYQTDLELLTIARRPTIQLRGDGRLQSESVSLPSGSDMSSLNIDQPLYSLRGYAEANYQLYDGGRNAAQRSVKAAELAVDQQDIAVAAYGLRERINQLFTGVDLLRTQADLLTITLASLETRREQVAAGVEYGVVLESELKQLAVQELELRKQQDNLAYRQRGLLATLSALIGRELPEAVILDFPEVLTKKEIPALDRPEQVQFARQRSLILAQSALIEAERRPKVNAYAQAGAGVPNPLNILDNGFSPYALVGVGAAWSITDWKKESISKQQLQLQAQLVDNQAATFDFNLNAQVDNYLAEVARLRAQINRAESIATLQAEILEQLSSQLDEGVINATDYLLQLNAELSAREQLSVYQAELRQVQLDFWNQRGGKS
jgi:outer membrane protein TolC